MQVKNRLIEESFRYTVDKSDMSIRSDEIADLSDIVAYCDKIKEKMTMSDDIWDVEVEKGITLADWLYSNSGKGSKDDRVRIREILSKHGICELSNLNIDISLGTWPNAVATEGEYINARRKILANIESPEEYFDFMKSCFIDSCFGEDILKEMKHIQNFSEHSEEITNNLSVLNDEAIDLYCKYQSNLKAAVDELSSKLLACSLDPKHRDSLWFSFEYEDLHINIRCEPHMKLIREDSDLRIYFYWKDDRIAYGKKVLIGRIGRHPWN